MKSTSSGTSFVFCRRIARVGNLALSAPPLISRSRPSALMRLPQLRHSSAELRTLPRLGTWFRFETPQTVFDLSGLIFKLGRLVFEC
jgi:hypothetical protein